MIIKTGNPGSSRAEVVIDGVFLDPTSVVRIEIHLDENEHDLAILTVAGINPRLITEMLNRPVKVTTEINTNLFTAFYGYVLSVQPTSKSHEPFTNKSLFQETKIVCLGASSDMRSKRTRNWENPNLRDIVTDIADTYRVSYSIPNDNFRLPRLVQRGESDWNLLVKTANKLGYVVTCHGTHLHIYSPAMSLGRGMPYVELTTPSQQNIGYAPGRILEFSADFSPSTGGGNKTVHFLDSSGNSFSLSASELRNQYLFSSSVGSRISEEEVIPASSYEEAEKALTAMETLQFSFSAEVTTTGVPFMVPGSIVNITNYKEADFNGIWLVRAVRHNIVRESFLTHFTLNRNTLTSDPLRIPSVSQFKTPPSPLLIGDKWKAKISVREHYD